MITGLTIAHGGDARLAKFDADDLDAFQRNVGGYLEAIDIPGHSDVLMLTDGEASLKGAPLNEKASLTAERPIVGNVILIGYAGEDFADLPTAEVWLETLGDNMGEEKQSMALRSEGWEVREVETD
jgi:hypothetical protein